MRWVKLPPWKYQNRWVLFEKESVSFKKPWHRESLVLTWSGKHEHLLCQRPHGQEVDDSESLAWILMEVRLFTKLHCTGPWLSCFLYHDMSPVKRICVFEHSVMTNFNCACPASQRGQGSGFLSEGSSWLTTCMSEQRRFWRDCADAQARLNLRCSHRR